MPKTYTDIFENAQYFSTELASRPIQSSSRYVPLCVCLSEELSLLIRANRSETLYFFSHKIEYINMILRILNLKGHQN